MNEFNDNAFDVIADKVPTVLFEALHRFWPFCYIHSLFALISKDTDFEE